MWYFKLLGKHSLLIAIAATLFLCVLFFLPRILAVSFLTPYLLAGIPLLFLIILSIRVLSEYNKNS